ncbi:MAG: sugar kinase [Deltaproteobacteria bacterium]|nr:sugar kinase [Deltaproteobacteria bacterium]
MFNLQCSMADVQVVGLGQACMDYLGQIPAYPDEDGKIQFDALHMQCGGPASTAMVTLSRLGIPTSFLGAVSDDVFGKEIVRNLEHECVDISFLKITPGYNSQFAFIAITADSGKRTIFWHRGTVPVLTPAHVDLTPFAHARVLHLDNLMMEASMAAAAQARARGMIVVMDAGTLRNGSRELCAHVDVLIASRAFAYALSPLKKGPEAALRSLQALGPQQAVITLGPRGSIGRVRHETIQQPAFQVKTMDTTGAGDVYHGAYIYGLLQNWDMPRCMRFASAAAALKCTRIGAQAGIPLLDEVEKLIKGQTTDDTDFTNRNM